MQKLASRKLFAFLGFGAFVTAGAIVGGIPWDKATTYMQWITGIYIGGQALVDAAQGLRSK